MSVVQHTVQRLLPRHLKIVDLAAAGHSYTAIAEIVKMSPRSVSLVLRSPLVQAELTRRRQASPDEKILKLDSEAFLGKARSILEQASEKAAKTTTALLDNDDPNIRLKAADRILDRVFQSKDSSKPIAVVNINTEQLQLLIGALKESEDVPKRKIVHNESDRPAAQAPEDECCDVPEASEDGAEGNVGPRGSEAQGLNQGV